MKPVRASLLRRLLLRWPLLLAVAFAAYSAALLSYAVGSWQRMRLDANNFLVADNTRRALALADMAGDLRSEATAHADIHEIRAYLANRDLGMSPRYGLNAGLALIEARFRQLAEKAGQRWGISAPRISYAAADGRVLVDFVPGLSSGATLPTPAGRFGLTIQPERGSIVISAPVIHQGKPDGMVVTEISVAALFRNLLVTESASAYRELLLTDEGRPLRAGDLDAALDARQWRQLAGISDNTVLPASEVLGAPFDGAAEGAVLVKTGIPGMPLVLVTLVPEKLAYGHLVSRHLLPAAGILLLLMVLGAFKLERMRQRADQLETGIANAELERSLTEFRNVELSAEIDRREAVELQLAESRERWELAVAGTNDGIWDWNIRSGEVFFSERWKAMLGHADGDIAGRVEEWSGRLHPDDSERVLDELQRHLRGETPYYQSHQRLRCKDGSYKWILARGRVLLGADGEPLRMAGSHTDITEQHNAEARISDRNEQLKAIFDLSPDGFVAFDSARCVKYANPAFLRMTGFSEAELAGLGEAEFSARLAAACVAGESFPGVAAMREDKEEEAGQALPLARPRLLIEMAGARKLVFELKLRIAQAATVSEILYLRDITHEVELDRMKSEFLSHAAHELRTPMASIYGFTELLITQEFDAATRKDLLETIHRQTQWLVDIINELLDLARIESRRGKDFHIERIALPSLLHELADATRVDPRRWPLSIDCADDLPPLAADRAKLRQALANVLGNAVKYSPGGGAIDIRCTLQAADDRRFVAIDVIDHGIGMTTYQAARVGERFYRADTSGKIPGTGLGMAIVREIVGLHGGGMAVESAIGAGTSVRLWLPCDTDQQERRFS